MNETVSREVCAKEHIRVNEKLAHHERWLGEHEKKIDELDKSDAKLTTKMETLCGQMAGLTKAIWGLVSSIGLLLLGFFVWYIQTGGVKSP